MLCGGGSLLLIALFRGETAGLHLAAIPARSWAAWGYLVVMGSFVAFNAFNYMLRHASPAAVSTYAFVNPVVAVFLGWALLGESISGRMAVSMGVIVLGVVMITLGPWVLRRWTSHGERV
jgi:drug/metabolite transporter (DMT)-like permease